MRCGGKIWVLPFFNLRLLLVSSYVYNMLTYLGERNIERKTNAWWIGGGGDTRAISVFRNLRGRSTWAWRRGGGVWQVQWRTPRHGCRHSACTLLYRMTRNEPERIVKIRLFRFRWVSTIFREWTFRPGESFGHVCGSMGVRFGRVHGRNTMRARLFPWRSRVDTAP